MIIAVIGEKGGTGKTTFAVHLAGWRKISGRRVMLLDADRQGSSSMWVERRQEHQLAMPECEQRFDTGVRRAIVDFARRHDDVVVDIGAGDGHLIEQVLGIANAAVVPFQPNEMDIWTIDLLDDLVRRAWEVNRDLTATAVLNRAPSHHASRDVRSALTALGQFDAIETSDCIVRERSSIRRAVPSGMLINEWTTPHDEKGIEELAKVYRLVFSEPAPIKERCLV